MIRLNNWLLVLSALAFVAGSSCIIYLLEPDTFQNPFNGFWWVMTTVTTVGYGDFYPVTMAGKLFAILLYLIGIGLIGVIIGKVVDAFSIFRRRRVEGRMKYDGENHIIIIGWSTKVKLAADEILLSDVARDIIIIDNLENAPLLSHHIHYVRGNAAEETTLSNANLFKAKAVIIFADDTISDPSLADGKTLLVATTIERMAPHVHTSVEIMMEHHIKNFKHIHVDDFILSHETISRLAVRSAFSTGITGIFTQLLSRQVGDDLYQVEKRQHWTTYRDAFNELLLEGATLIADRQSLDINRNLDCAIPEHAVLYVICDEATYDKLKAKRLSGV